MEFEFRMPLLFIKKWRKEGRGWGAIYTVFAHPQEEQRKRDLMAIISITREEGRKEGIGWGGGTTIPREEWRKGGRGLRVYISITRIINFSKKVKVTLFFLETF